MIKKRIDLFSAYLAEDNIEVIYPEIGYFELGKVIDDLNIRQKKPTKGSRMSIFA
jgi:hypothetical protein